MLFPGPCRLGPRHRCIQWVDEWGRLLCGWEELPINPSSACSPPRWAGVWLSERCFLVLVEKSGFFLIYEILFTHSHLDWRSQDPLRQKREDDPPHLLPLMAERKERRGEKHETMNSGAHNHDIFKPGSLSGFYLEQEKTWTTGRGARGGSDQRYGRPYPCS